MYSVGMMIRGTMYPKKGHFIYKFVKVGGGYVPPMSPGSYGHGVNEHM